MSYQRSLPTSEYLAAHPHNTDVSFSFPDGRQLAANKLLLSIACNQFHNMFSGNWKEEQVQGVPLFLPPPNFLMCQNGEKPELVTPIKVLSPHLATHKLTKVVDPAIFSCPEQL